MTDDGVRCALEYDCVRWGRHDLSPQAGIGVYERGPDGLLATARVYDDERALEHRSRPIELRLTVHAEELSSSPPGASPARSRRSWPAR